MVAGKSSEIGSSKVLLDMKEFPLSAVICPEAVAFADKIIKLTSQSVCGKTIQDSETAAAAASKLTPVENSTTVITDIFLSSQEDSSSITTIPETPSGSQQEQPPLQEEDSTQQVSVESTSQAKTIGCLATMTMEELNIPSHIDTQILHHSVCVLVSLLFRFPVYFKPLYRLAWLFYKLKAFQVNC